MGNTQSIKSDNILKSPREELLQEIAYGGDSPYMSEINVELVNMEGGYDDEEDEINVEIVSIAGGSYTEDYSNFIGGGGCGSGRDDDINVDIVSMAGGSTDLQEQEHIDIYQEIKDRIGSYNQAGGSSNNNDFFKMLEEKLNGVQSESPFISNNVNKFAESLQKGGYMEETETSTITANKLLQKIVQMGGDSSSSSSEDSDFTSTEETISESSDSDSVSSKTKNTFPLYAVGRQTKQPDYISEDVSEDVSEDDDEYHLSSSSLETDDINLISYSPSK
jgi:hypothetical protein